MITTCVFDAYGTLFDVHSAVARHAGRIGPKADELSRLWRARQVEYAWCRSLMGRHRDFWSLTADALDFALRSYGVADAALRDDLLNAYLHLAAYPEVPATLDRLRRAGYRTAILTNGTPDMVDSAVRSAGLETLIDATLSIESAGIYKPHPSVYQLVLDHLQVTADEVCFQSSNPWDAAGAGVFGFTVAWINRAGQPREYPLDFPLTEMRSLAELPDFLPQRPTS